MAQTKRKRRSKHRGNAAGRRRDARPHRPPPDRGGAQEGGPRDRARAPDEQAADLEQRVPEGGADGRPAVPVHARSACSAATPRSASRSSCASSRVLLYTPLAYVDRPLGLPAQPAPQAAAEDVNVRCLTVGPLQENCWIVDGAERAIVIDPGDEADRLIAELEQPVEAILLTHTHFDHVGAVAAARAPHRRAGLLPADRGPDPAGHQQLRLPGLRPVRAVRPRGDARRRRAPQRSRASTSTSSSRPATARAT